MATTPLYTGLGNGGSLGSSAAALFTVSSGHVTYPRGIHLHNQGSNTNAELVQIYIVPNGGSAGDSTEYLYETLTPGQTLIVDLPALGWVLKTAGDTVQGKAAHASKVNWWLLGDDSS